MEFADPKNSTDFRRVLGRFPTGLVIVTTAVDGKPFGLTCQAFTSVSLDPPLVATFLARETGSLWAIDTTKKFAVSILSEDQLELARIFAISGADKFRDVPITQSPNGLPVVAEALAWMECAVDSRFEAGDHIGLLGLVTSMGSMGDQKPLLYWRGGYGMFP